MTCGCGAVDRARGLRHGPLLLDALAMTARALLPPPSMRDLVRSEIRFAVCYLTSSGWPATNVNHLLLDHLGVPRTTGLPEREVRELVISAQPLAERKSPKRPPARPPREPGPWG